MNAYAKEVLLKKFKQTIARYDLLEIPPQAGLGKGDKVLVAVSGGPDSVALLYALLEIKDEFGLDLCVGHLNHKLRGRESDQDQKFVKNLASELNLKFFSKSIDVKKEAKKKKLSLEEGARLVRYGYLEDLADRIKANKIAVGHQADDQAETFLMRLLRGAGGAGLSGIPPKRGKIIRPLIEIKREEIERFLKEKKLSYRTDSSNLLPNYFRNKTRLVLLPLIQKEFNPKIVDVLNRASSVISLQQQYVEKNCEEVLRFVCKSKRKDKIVLDLKRFIEYDMCLKREMIRLCVKELIGDQAELSFDSIERTLSLIQKQNSGRRVRLTGSIWAEVSGENLAIYIEKKKQHNYTISLPGKKNLGNLGMQIKSEIVSRSSLPGKIKSKGEEVAFLDWGKLKGPFRLRSRRPKDKFKPLGMQGTKSIADFLIDMKVPRYERDEVMLLTTQGKIAWILGYRISDEFKVTDKTKKVLRIELIQKHE
ncbi:MAG: tRNA lysidine(34) synthetase TilS [candidate division Zixibacteria bacterium]|nr:tRNA lysidine(34) synthetase TilS [candidate division Zixibacteria bacterium]